MEFVFIFVLALVGLLFFIASKPVPPAQLPPPQQPWVPPQLPAPPTPASRVRRAIWRSAPTVFRKVKPKEESPPGPCHICGRPMMKGESHGHQ